MTPALPRSWDIGCFYNIVYYALFLQIKGEQAVQEQATAWQDIIAAKKEAVGLQVDYIQHIVIIIHFDSLVTIQNCLQ